VIPAGEPGHVGDVADHGAGVDWAEAEDLGEAGARGSDGRGQFLLGIAELGVQASQVLQELAGQLVARRRDRAGRGDLLQDAGGVSCGDLLADAAGEQPAAPRAADKRPDCGPGPGRGAAWTAPSAPPRDPRPPPGAGTWSAAPRQRPTARRSGRSCSCPRPAAAAPGRPAWAARPAPAPRRRPAAGPAGDPRMIGVPSCATHHEHACDLCKQSRSRLGEHCRMVGIWQGRQR